MRQTNLQGGQGVNSVVIQQGGTQDPTGSHQHDISPQLASVATSAPVTTKSKGKPTPTTINNGPSDDGRSVATH